MLYKAVEYVRKEGTQNSRFWCSLHNNLARVEQVETTAPFG